VPLSWNEIRARAASFAEEWKDAHYEKGDTHSFYNAFFEVFGQKRRSVAVYEKKVKKLNDKQGYIDLFWPGTLLVEQKSAGKNLQKAQE
jgi:restriction-modification enzyme MmeI-like protein